MTRTPAVIFATTAIYDIFDYHKKCRITSYKNDIESISLSTYTDNEADRCEGFKKVSIEIVQGYEWTTQGYQCINKCTLEVNKFHSFYQKYWCTFSRNYQGFKASCTPCISRGEFCKNILPSQIMIQNFDLSV